LPESRHWRTSAVRALVHLVRRTRLTLVACWLVSAWSCAPAPIRPSTPALVASKTALAASPNETPLSLFVGRWGVVDAAVGGQHTRFVIDTGANHTLVDSKIAAERGGSA